MKIIFVLGDDCVEWVLSETEFGLRLSTKCRQYPEKDMFVDFKTTDSWIKINSLLHGASKSLLNGFV